MDLLRVKSLCRFIAFALRLQPHPSRLRRPPCSLVYKVNYFTPAMRMEQSFVRITEKSIVVFQELAFLSSVDKEKVYNWKILRSSPYKLSIFRHYFFKQNASL